jgi:uncharacterized membrane protein
VLLAEAEPVDWILSALLVLAWITFWVVRRRVPVWFFVAAVLLSILCVPAGLIAGEAELRGSYCRPGDLCSSMNEVHWWMDSLLGLLTTVVLAFFTPFVSTGVEALQERRNRRPR